MFWTCCAAVSPVRPAVAPVRPKTSLPASSGATWPGSCGLAPPGGESPPGHTPDLGTHQTSEERAPLHVSPFTGKSSRSAGCQI